MQSWEEINLDLANEGDAGVKTFVLWMMQRCEKYVMTQMRLHGKTIEAFIVQKTWKNVR